MDQKTQSADQIVQRLEALKSKLGDRKELAGEIDQIAQSVRQAVGGGSQQSQGEHASTRESR